jgi:hypothetical protein
MPNKESISVGKVPDRRSLIELKTWLEGARDMLILAIQGAESELERIRQIESVFAKTEALSPVVERLMKIRDGMENFLEILRDQDGQWVKRITWVENLGKISAAWEASTEVSDMPSLIELKTWLEGTRVMLILAIQGAESELGRIRQIESVFAKTEALSPVVESLTKIRDGVEAFLDILRYQDGEWGRRITWVENLERISAAWEASTELGGGESRVEVQDEVPSEPSVFDFGVDLFPDEEQATVYERKTITAALSKTFSERTLLIFFSLFFAIVLSAASLTYLIANQFHRLEIGELYKSISMLKDELSTSYSANKELTLKNADLNNIAESEAGLNELKDKNNELELALQAANSSLAESKNDLHVMQANSLGMISELKAKSLEIASTRTELEVSRYLFEFFKAESGGSFILNPVWLKYGESAKILDGRLTIRIEQASSQNSSSDVLVHLSSQAPFATLGGMNQFKKTFCPLLGIPENFRLKNNRCSVVLLGSKTTEDETKAYLVAVFKKNPTAKAERFANSD